METFFTETARRGQKKTVTNKPRFNTLNKVFLYGSKDRNRGHHTIFVYNLKFFNTHYDYLSFL